jgi:hypothetical protein
MTLSSSGPTDFVDHLNSAHQNIQFTMEMERDSQFPSLDTRPDGSMGHDVYHKLSHTDFYLKYNLITAH